LLEIIKEKYFLQKEEERLRASLRRESKQKRVRERGAGRGLSAGYLEPDNREEEGSEDEGAISLAAIKSKYKNKTSTSKSKCLSLCGKPLMPCNFCIMTNSPKSYQ
jgi:hypothetical protein